MLCYSISARGKRTKKVTVTHGTEKGLEKDNNRQANVEKS